MAATKSWKKYDFALSMHFANICVLFLIIWSFLSIYLIQYFIYFFNPLTGRRCYFSDIISWTCCSVSETARPYPKLEGEPPFSVLEPLVNTEKSFETREIKNQFAKNIRLLRSVWFWLVIYSHSIVRSMTTNSLFTFYNSQISKAYLPK